jgi:F-type H+/Na+-transporting ATPase subunit alpha
MVPDADRTRQDEGTRKMLRDSLDQAVGTVERQAGAYDPEPNAEEVGRVVAVGRGVIQARGLEHVGSEELVLVHGARHGADRGTDADTNTGAASHGLVLDIREDRLGIVLLTEEAGLGAGAEVTRSGRILDLPVGDGLLGRVVDPLGRALDDRGAVTAERRLPVFRPAPPIMHRAPVQTPLQTGIKVVDAILPVGRGQRELILGDRQTGKTALAVDAIINQRDSGVLCVYCSIGQRGSSVAKVIDELRRNDALSYTVVVVVEGDAPPGLQYVAPYAATSIAEHFMEQGQDVLLVYDDLTRHAVAYRELSLLLRRPPGREAFPGDIFYVHSSLLERATRLRPEHGGGSITALPIIETEAQNLSAYIPTNCISITDGQIYLSPELFQKGVLPAVEVGRSVSRVGGKAQLPAYGGLAGEIRLAYAEFEELETFARFGTRLDEATRANLEHGRRIREILKQEQAAALTAAEQVFVLSATAKRLLDHVPLRDVPKAERLLRDALPQDLEREIMDPNLDRKGVEELRERLLEAAETALAQEFPKPETAVHGV